MELRIPNFSEEGLLENCLGIKFANYDKEGDKFEMRKPFLIDHIIDYLGFEQRMANSQSMSTIKPLIHCALVGNLMLSVTNMMDHLQ